jgi:hypothetical protein
VDADVHLHGPTGHLVVVPIARLYEQRTAARAMPRSH